MITVINANNEFPIIITTSSSSLSSRRITTSTTKYIRYVSSSTSVSYDRVVSSMSCSYAAADMRGHSASPCAELATSPY